MSTQDTPPRNGDDGLGREKTPEVPYVFPIFSCHLLVRGLTPEHATDDAGSEILMFVKKTTRKDLAVTETMMTTKVKDDEGIVTGTRRRKTVKSVERGEGMMRPRKRGKNDEEDERRRKGSGKATGTGRAMRATDEGTDHAATGLLRESLTDLNGRTDRRSPLPVISTWIVNVLGNERTKDVSRKIDDAAAKESESEDLDTMRYVGMLWFLCVPSTK